MTEQTALAVKEEMQLGSLNVESKSVVHRATMVANELAKIVEDKKLYTNIQGKKFVNVEGWSTMGGMLGIVPRECGTPVLRKEDDGYEEYEATVELVRVSDGAIIGRASAIVGTDEKTWAKRPRYARRSMAVTRATGKAYRLGFSWIMSIAGFQPTPAEEMQDVVEGSFKPKSKAVPRQPETIVQELGYDPEPQPKTQFNGKGRPYDPPTLKAAIQKMATKHLGETASKAQVGLVAGMLSQIFLSDNDKRHTVQQYLFQVDSLNDADPEKILAALDWLKPESIDGEYKVDDVAAQEAQAVLAQEQAE